MNIVQISPLLQKRLAVTAEELTEFCRRWSVSELALFGSVLREDFGAESDVDLLVSYQPEAKRGLFEKMKMKAELELLLQRDVDLVSRRAIERSQNWLRRKNILDSAEVIYVA